jgi:hypothetical protein
LTAEPDEDQNNPEESAGADDGQEEGAESNDLNGEEGKENGGARL